MNKSPESKDINTKSKKTKVKSTDKKSTKEKTKVKSTDKRSTNEKIKETARANGKACVARANNKAINSMRYVMANFPYPIFKTVSSNGVNWPIRVGLTRGGTLTGYERCVMTMCCVTISEIGAGKDGPAQFCRRVKRFLPKGVLLSPEWFIHQKRMKNPKVSEVVDEFREWFKSYMEDCQTELATQYMYSGDRAGSHFLKVLERRFRENWNPSYQINMEAKVTGKVDTTVNFNFDTIEGHEMPDLSNIS